MSRARGNVSRSARTIVRMNAMPGVAATAHQGIRV